MLHKQTCLETCWRKVTPYTSVWQKFDSDYWSKGYVRPLVATVFFGFGWVCFFVFSAILTIYCIIISLLLFWYGIVDTWRWWKDELSSADGTKDTDNYVETSDDMVFRLNSSTNKGSKHFRVDRLLKMTTGLDAEDIWRRIELTENIQDHITGKELAGDSEYSKLALFHDVSTRYSE